MSQRIKLLFLFAIGVSFQAEAQLGGQKSFEFLNVANNARLAGLGGVNVSLADRDINFIFSNPALISDSLAGVASAGYLFYIADIGQSTFSYAHDFGKIGTLTFGVQHIDYGEITGYDEAGIETGTFHSGETALLIGKSHKVSFFTMGVNLKAVFSNMAGFRSTAMMMDIGGMFRHPTQDFTIGLVFKSIGAVLSEFSETSNSEIPFDVQLGMTFKPQHMPVRFSLTGYNFSGSGAIYDDPSDDEDNPGSLDKVLRHFNFAAEILFHRNVNVLLGYNYLRRLELRDENSGSGGGLTIGFSATIKSVDFSFSRVGYSIGNGGYNITLSTNIEKMILKRRTR